MYLSAARICAGWNRSTYCGNKKIAILLGTNEISYAVTSKSTGRKFWHCFHWQATLSVIEGPSTLRVTGFMHASVGACSSVRANILRLGDRVAQHSGRLRGMQCAIMQVAVG